MATIRLNSNELDMNFVEGIKRLFPNQEITVRVEGGAMDETEFLLSSPKNRERLLQSIVDLNAGKVISFTMEELQKYVDEGK